MVFVHDMATRPKDQTSVGTRSVGAAAAPAAAAAIEATEAYKSRRVSGGTISPDGGIACRVREQRVVMAA